MNPPGKLTGSHELVRWLNQLRDFSIENKLTSVLGGRFSRGSSGTQIICQSGGGAAPQPTPDETNVASITYSGERVQVFNNKVYVSGMIQTANDLRRIAIAVFDLNLNLDPVYWYHSGANGASETGYPNLPTISTFLASTDGVIAVSFSAGYVNGWGVGDTARLNHDGSVLYLPLNTNSSTVSDMCDAGVGSRFIAIGTYWKGTAITGGVLRVSTTTLEGDGYSYGSGFTAADHTTASPPHRCLSDTGTKQFFAGYFNHYNGTDLRALNGGTPIEGYRVARLDGNGLDATWGTGVAFQGFIWAIEKLSSGKLLVAGSFFSADVSTGSVSLCRIARLDTDGTIDATFADDGFAGTSLDGNIDVAIKCLAVQSDGKILVGTTNGLWRLNADGTLDETFTMTTANDEYAGSISDMAVIPSTGNIVMVGTFDHVDGEVRHNIALLSSTGTLLG